MHSSNSISVINKKENFLQPNNFNLIMLGFTVSIGSFIFGYLTAECNQMYPILKVLFSWDEAELNLYSSLMLALFLAGLLAGALLARYVFQLDRRMCMICSNILLILLEGLCLVESVPVICLARFFKGFFTLFLVMLTSMLVNETAPKQSLSYLGTFTNTGISLGALFALTIGTAFQNPDDISVPEDVNNYWRFIFILPAFFSLLQIFLVLIVFKNVSIVESIKNGKKEQAIWLIEKVYANKESAEKIFEYLQADITHSKIGGARVSYKDALCKPAFRNSTLIVCAIFFFVRMCGANPISAYSTNLFLKMKEDRNLAISPKLGTLILGGASILGSTLSMVVVKYVKARPLMVYGQLGTALLLLLIGTLQALEFHLGALVSVFAYMFFHTITNQSKVYVYTTEIANTSTALAMSFFVAQFTNLLLAIGTQPLFDSAINSQGVFWLLGGISTVGGIFFYFTIQETEGLTYGQKATLYTRIKDQSETKEESEKEESEKGSEANRSENQREEAAGPGEQIFGMQKPQAENQL